MAVELIIQSNTYLNQFKNGATYATSTSDTTFNLAGTVMEKLQYTSTVDVSWKYKATPSASLFWESLGSDLFRFSKSAGSWVTGQNGDGFSVGDDVDWVYTTNGVTYTVNGDITILMSDWMYIQFTVTPGGLTGITDGESTGSTIYGKSNLASMIYSFGLIDNNEVFNTNSKVSGNNQSYYVDSLVTATPQTMTKLGTFSDWITGSITCEKIANPSTYVQRYKLIHNFIINPYYLDGELSDLTSGTIPALYAGGNSLKHVVGVDLRTGLSDPNTSKVATMDTILGSTGYFGQNFNGFANDYSITSTTYENSASASADGILTAEETTIRVTVSKTSGNFVATDKIGAYVSLLPTATDYTDTTTDLEYNFIYDNLHCLAGGVTVTQASSFIDEVTATLSGGDILLVIKTTLTVAQQVYLASLTTPYFLLAIQAGDITKTNVSSDRVMMVADALPFDTSADISGLIAFNDLEYFAHDMTPTVGTGFTSLATWNEDGVIMNFNFDLDLNKAALLNNMQIVLVSVDATTGDYFELNSEDLQLGNIVSGGVQQINISTDRGYTLATASPFNAITLTTGTQSAGFQNYICTVGLKMTWQEWIQNLDVPTEFYDSTEPNNNFNYKASNYANTLQNNVLKIGIKANVYGEDSTLGTSGVTDYIGYAGDITTYNYDEDVLSPSPRFTGVITTFTEDGVTNLGGAIQTNGDNTLVKTTWTDNTYGSFGSVWNYYGIHRLEPVNAQGFAIEELSSITLPPASQVMQPITGGTLLDMAVVGSNLVSTSIIDGSAQNTGINYKMSSRLQSPNTGGELKLINFYVQWDRVQNLTVVLTKSGATTQWDYGDGSVIDTTNSTAHAFPTVKVLYLVTANVFDYDSITVWNATNDQIQGNFNWSNLLNVTDFTLSSAVDLDVLQSPTTATVMTSFDVNRSGMPLLNISGLTGLGGIFDCNNAGNLTTITLPVSTQTFSLFDASVCTSLTALDVSPLSGLAGVFNCKNSSLLTSLTLPSSTGLFSQFNCGGCDLAYFDITVLSNVTESNNVIFPMSNNSFTATEVNHFLVDLDSISTGGFTGRSITINGTNAAPDGSSGGFDGTTAKANLITKGFTVTTN